MSPSDPSNDDRLPGSVSNQNSEEAEPGHGGEGSAEHRESAHEQRRHGSSGSDDAGGGESKEGSQSTGHPDSAG